MTIFHTSDRRALLAGCVAIGAGLGAAAPALSQSSDSAPVPAAVIDEIIVTASRRPQPVEQLGSAVSVITAEDIERQQLTALDEVLERTPGVSITRSGGVGQNTQVRMRGFTTKHVLIMIDGIKVNNASQSSNQFNIDHLFLNNVERVEILRGPQSGLYGADAVAGVVNVITRRGEGPPKVRASTLYGTHNTYETTLASDGRVGAFGYSAGAAYFDTDGISLASRPPGNTEADGYVNLTLDMRLHWDPNADFALDGWVRYIEAENETDNSFLPADNPLGLPAFLFQDSPGFTDNEQLFAALKGTFRTFDGRLTHEAQVSLVDIAATSVTPGSTQDSEGVTTEAIYHATYDLGGDSFVLAGVEWREEDAQFGRPGGGAFAAIDESLTNAAVFANVSLQPLAGLYLSGAARYDDNELFGGEATFRVSAAYNLQPSPFLAGVDTKLRASYGTGAESPSLRQLLGSSPTFQGNPNLQPESTWMVDAGVDQRLENGRARWSVTAYLGRATDGIFNVFDPAARLSSPINIDSPVEMRGVETEIQLSPADWIDLNAAYTYAEVFTVSDDNQLFGRPKHIASVAATVRPSVPLSITADAYWRSEFFSDFPSTFELPGYALFNLGVAYDLTDQLRLSAKVQNLFDKTYEEKLGDSTYGRTAQIRLSFVY